MRRLLLLALLIVSQVQAFEADSSNMVILKGPLQVQAGKTESLKLPRRLFVHKLSILAEAAGSRPSLVEIESGGDIKGTLYLPASDPHYWVTVERETDSIELHVTQGTARFLEIRATVSESGTAQPFPSLTHSKMGQLSSELIWLTDKLDKHTVYPDTGSYLLPIKKKSAVAYAIAEAQGDLSGSARPYYEDLLRTLDYAKPYFDKMLEVENAVELVIKIMSHREKIRTLLK